MNKDSKYRYEVRREESANDFGPCSEWRVYDRYQGVCVRGLKFYNGNTAASWCDSLNNASERLSATVKRMESE